MNSQTIKNRFTQSFGRTGLKLQKRSPEILLGVGIVGVIATVFMVAKAAQKQNDLSIEIEETFAVIEDEHEYKVEQSGLALGGNERNKALAIAYVKTGLQYARLYGPAAGVGVLSIMAILASHGVMANRQVALVAAYNLLNEGFKSYRERVVEELGEDKDSEFYLGLRSETYTEKGVDEEGNKTKTKKVKLVADPNQKTGSIYSRFFDEANPQYRSDRLLNKAFLMAQQNYANDVLILRGHLFLNEVYERLGFQHTKEGAIVGWVLKDPKTMRDEDRDGYVSFGFLDIDVQPVTREFVNLTNPSVLLDFNVDGIIFDLI